MQKKIIIHSFCSTLNIYLLVVHTKKIIIHSFWSTLNIYLLVVHTKKIIIHLFWSTFVKDLKRNFSCKIYKKKHTQEQVVFFVPTQKCMK